MRGRATAACAFVFALTTALPAEAGERRIATLAPEGSLWMKQMRKGAAKIAEATEGRVKTKYYGGGVQGDEKDVVRKMAVGHLDGAALTSVGLSLIYPGIRVLGLPAFYDSVEELDYVREKMWPYFQGKFRERGYELLAPGDVGWIYLFSTKKINSMAELKAAKVWVWDADPTSSGVLTDLGLRGVPLGVPEVMPALTTGKVEAVFNSPLGAVALQWHTKVRYMSSVPIAYGIGGMVMTKKAWDSASDADKKIQVKVGRKLTAQTIKRVRRDNKRAIKAMARYGVQQVTTPSDIEKEMTTQAKKMWKDWVGEHYSQKELDMVLKYRAEFRKKK